MRHAIATIAVSISSAATLFGHSHCAKTSTDEFHVYFPDSILCFIAVMGDDRSSASFLNSDWVRQTMHEQTFKRQADSGSGRNGKEPPATEGTRNKNDDEIRRAMRARRGSPFLTTKEAAFYLGRRPRTLKRWRQMGKGPPYRLAERSVLYHIDEIDAWFKYGFE